MATTKALELSQLAKGLAVDTNGNITAIAIDDYLDAYVTSNSLATESYVSTAISNLVDSAPSTLDTLNELAAALNDDANFASTVTTALGTKLNTSDFSTTADTWLTGKDTADLVEGTNLYYTDSRFDTRLATKTTDNLTEGTTNKYYSSTLFDTDFGLKSTDDLTEGSTNLYYSQSAADALIADATALAIALG